MNQPFSFQFDSETLGRLFMPRANTFEVMQASVIQEQFVIDSIVIDSEQGRCRLSYSEWEEQNTTDAKIWVSEYAIELTVGGQIAYGTYSATFNPEERSVGLVMEQLKRHAEADFILCAKLIGRSVRRDLVVDEEEPQPGSSAANLH